MNGDVNKKMADITTAEEEAAKQNDIQEEQLAQGGRQPYGTLTSKISKQC